MSTFRSSTRALSRLLIQRPRRSPPTTVCSNQLGLNGILGSTRALNRSLSSADPVEMVSGLTQAQVDASPEIQEFLDANFKDEGSTSSDGFSVPVEVLKEYGYDESDFAPADEGRQYGDPRIDAGMGNEAQQALNIRTISTYLRTEEGTRACDRLRDEKWIPGMLYGSDPIKGISSTDKDSKVMLKTKWPELQRELDRYHRKFESRVYDLTVYEDPSDTEGTVHRVLPRDVQRHPVQGKIYCANFLRYHPGRPIKIPIVYINQEESPALKRDGFIIPVNKYVECMVEDGVPIPPSIDLECTGLKLKDVIRVDRLIFPEGVRPSKRVDPEKFVIGPVAGGRGGAQEADDDAADDEEEK